MAPILDKFTGGGQTKKIPEWKVQGHGQSTFHGKKMLLMTGKAVFLRYSRWKQTPDTISKKSVWPRCCRTDGKKLGEEQLAPPPPNLLKMAVFNLMSLLKPGYTCDVARYDYHPVVCNKLRTVYAGRYPLVIHCSHYVNRKAQNCTCKHPFRPRYLL